MTVLDSGFLVAVERRKASVPAILLGAAGSPLLVLTVVLSQVWRGGGPRQAVLSRFLELPEIALVPVGAELGRAAGVLMGRSGTSDAVDACVVALALSKQAPVVTSDAGDLRRLGPRVRLVEV